MADPITISVISTPASTRAMEAQVIANARDDAIPSASKTVTKTSIIDCGMLNIMAGPNACSKILENSFS